MARGGREAEGPVDSLLERESVLAELDRCWRRSARGAGRVALLRGEAGVGKTAAIGAFVAGLDVRTRVLRGWCDRAGIPGLRFVLHLASNLRQFTQTIAELRKKLARPPVA
jgi:predicted ATPase